MSTAPPPPLDPSQTHGLTYEPHLPASLPTRNSIPLLSTTHFASLHLQHILSHPPDHVLFPFLHGLEGNNEAQNLFFASSGPPRPPRYRGLVCVVCEDDLNDAVTLRVLRRREHEDEEEEDIGSESEYEDEYEDERFFPHHSHDGPRDYLRETQAPVPEPSEVMDVDNDMDVEDPNQAAHMHPVAHRPQPSSSPPATGAPALSLAIPLPTSPPSPPKSTGTGTPSSSDSDSDVPFSFENEGEGTVSSSITSVSAGSSPIEESKELHDPTPKPPPQATQKQFPALLTSTFRPKELIRRVSPSTSKKEKESAADEWEFVPVRVPDGISLRNFGIQVPIYATLSDIVVYSPRGATPAAIALAQRFKQAVERKRRERMRNAGVCDEKASAEDKDKDGEDAKDYITVDISSNEEAESYIKVDTTSKPDADVKEKEGEEEDEGFLKYNVFVLNATLEDMKRDIPHLMMRICGQGVPGVVSSTTPTFVNGEVLPLGDMNTATGAHTDRSDGHVVEQRRGDDVEERERRGVGMDMDMVGSMDLDEPTPTLSDTDHDDAWHNTVDFAQRERDEMRDLTKASEIITLFPPTFSPNPAIDISSTQSHYNPFLGQIFLGNSSDLPLAPENPGDFHHAAYDGHTGAPGDPFDFVETNDPGKGFGYDVCIECHDLAPFPSAQHLRAAEEHLMMLEVLWSDRERERCAREGKDTKTMRPRPPPHANAVIHFPFPSSPPNTQTTMNGLIPVIRFLEKWIKPVPVPSSSAMEPVPESARRWSSVSASSVGSVPPGPAGFGGGGYQQQQHSRSRAFTSPPPPPPSLSSSSPRSRPLKVLIFSSDGYTESSVPALCLLMAMRGLTLPEAYLELQVAKKRSFFVYQADLGMLKRVESRFRDERERERERERDRERERERMHVLASPSHGVNANGKRVGGRFWGFGSGSGSVSGSGVGVCEEPQQQQQRPTPVHAHNQPQIKGRPAAKSVSFAQAPSILKAPPLPPIQTPPIVVPSLQQQLVKEKEAMVIGGVGGSVPNLGLASELEREASASASATTTADPGPVLAPAAAPTPTIKSRPRANTSPWLPSLFGGDHQSWFNDPRFDGSFPSRVLPFLYLGNLNHASNVYMLHALGITHVVSVGECALVPPPHHVNGTTGYGSGARSGPGAHYLGKSSGQGSLWTEEREGRIKVLDIKGVCDDGIDTLEPQLEPICDWIDKARQEGGQVLVHCRVGVSRSATVTIAYVMKHLSLPLVDAYLIVRSRRLSVLIQPNMRLLYNLCGWEIKLAKERAGTDEKKLRRELSRTLSWPYLAKEVHALNEKYLH